MNNFLTSLYFEYFKAVDRLNELSARNDFCVNKCDESHEEIRIIRAISETESTVKMLEKLINEYLEQVYRGNQ